MNEIATSTCDLAAIRAQMESDYERESDQPGYTITLHGGPLDKLLARVDRSPQPIGITYCKVFSFSDGEKLEVVYRRASDGGWHFESCRVQQRSPTNGRAGS